MKSIFAENVSSSHRSVLHFPCVVALSNFLFLVAPLLTIPDQGQHPTKDVRPWRHDDVEKQTNTPRLSSLLRKKQSIVVFRDMTEQSNQTRRCITQHSFFLHFLQVKTKKVTTMFPRSVRWRKIRWFSTVINRFHAPSLVISICTLPWVYRPMSIPEHFSSTSRSSTISCHET